MIITRKQYVQRRFIKTYANSRGNFYRNEIHSHREMVTKWFLFFIPIITIRKCLESTI